MQIEICKNYNDSYIDRLYFDVTSSLQDTRTYVSEMSADIDKNDHLHGAEKWSIQDSLVDENYEAEMTALLAEELTIIALYKTLELSIKGMMKYSDLYSGEEIRRVFSFKKLKELMRDRIVEINTLDGFESFNELRCINNSVKHSGMVNNELGQIGQWVEGEPLSDLYSHYTRLKPEVNNFINELAKHFMQAIA